MFDHSVGLALKGLRSQFSKKFLASNFSLSNADGNTSGPLHRGGIAQLLLLRILIDNKQVWQFQQGSFIGFKNPFSTIRRIGLDLIFTIFGK